MIGFNQAEVENMLDYYIKQKMIPEKEREKILEELKVENIYDGVIS